MKSLASRIILSIVIGLVSWGLTYLLGLVIGLIPFISPIGGFIMFVSPLVGLLAGIWYFFTNRTVAL